MHGWVKGALIGTAMLGALAAPAQADVKRGVDAWQRGDYTAAISEWRGPAESGDADAQFNLAQAYKLGRGVKSDMNQALEWFRRAAQQGHARAADNYGLLLFQQNRRSEAMPYIEKSANRGEPRAQYILGTALFNGELVGKDWVRAYAMMSRASTSGLPQAKTSLAQMDKFIPEDQRRQGRGMAATLPGESQLAAADATLSTPAARAAPAPTPARGSSVVRTTQLPPSTVAGMQATESDDRRADTPAPRPTPQPVRAAPAAAPLPTPAASGGWRVQLGAFSGQGRAQSLWATMKNRVSGLSAYTPYFVAAGGVTRLQVGPLRNEAEANRLCASVKAAGNACIPKRP